MDLSIARFHARFTSTDDDRLMTALRSLRRLADLEQADPVPPAVWTVWAAAEAAVEAPIPCRS